MLWDSISGGRIHTNNSVKLKGVTEVVSWGHLIEGRQGWRAEHVRIEQILINVPTMKCQECGNELIPSTKNNQDGSLYWFCDYSEGELKDSLRNTLTTQLMAFYQCPVVYLNDGKLGGEPYGKYTS